MARDVRFVKRELRRECAEFFDAHAQFFGFHAPDTQEELRKDMRECEHMLNRMTDAMDAWPGNRFAQCQVLMVHHPNIVAQIRRATKKMTSSSSTRNEA